MSKREINVLHPNSAADMEKQKPHLSCELILEILSYLPVLSLLKLRTVCKSWHDTIKDPRFVDKHRQQQAGLTIACYSDRTPRPFRETHAVLCLLHGLQLQVCISTHTYRIKNPSTRQVLSLPRTRIFVLTMTMGYISKRKEYKVVYLYLEELRSDRLGCEFLTVGTDSSWRPVNIPETIYDPDTDRLKDCMLIEGVFYVNKDSATGYSKIICIEIEKEHFAEVDIPCNVFASRDAVWPLHWNCTKYALSNVKKHILHVWILEDYTEERGYMNKIDIPLSFLQDFPDLDHRHLSIRVITDDIMLFAIKSKHIIFYSIKSARIIYEVSAPPGKKFFYAYTRSTLVSLSGMLPESCMDNL